jgi:hypothetical protein
VDLDDRHRETGQRVADAVAVVRPRPGVDEHRGDPREADGARAGDRDSGLVHETESDPGFVIDVPRCPREAPMHRHASVRPYDSMARPSSAATALSCLTRVHSRMSSFKAAAARRCTSMYPNPRPNKR